LCRRELVRFLRQRHRVIGALATPIVFWLLIGGGMGRSFNPAGSHASLSGGYMEYFFPGTVLMILLFTAIFSTISIIEDRKEGFLQSVLVAPISRLQIVGGKVLGGTVLAFGQGLVFLLLAPLTGIHFSIVGFLLACATMLILSASLTALGFCIAWRMSSSQGFHAIMNLFLMPMWFLSGALFPIEGAWKGLRIIMRLNPLSYGLEALRDAIHWQTATISHFVLCLGVSLLFAIVLTALATWVAVRPVAADFQ
jgi:ABC-2 type transport system permease protein